MPKSLRAHRHPNLPAPRCSADAVPTRAAAPHRTQSPSLVRPCPRPRSAHTHTQPRATTSTYPQPGRPRARQHAEAWPRTPRALPQRSATAAPPAPRDRHEQRALPPPGRASPYRALARHRAIQRREGSQRAKETQNAPQEALAWPRCTPPACPSTRARSDNRHPSLRERAAAEAALVPRAGARQASGGAAARTVEGARRRCRRRRGAGHPFGPPKPQTGSPWLVRALGRERRQ
mmetsp:Transcript_5361/g.21125  ORF Transcript_5361/g.21125 Transcript_5361/m.21125 type:complete len:234 (+) Transcript_5361:1832-2533(+)